MFTNRLNSRVVYEIGVGEHDDDVSFVTGSRNVAVLRMCNEKYPIWPLFVARFLAGSHGLVNSAMGQIPCSTERISS